MICNLIRRFVFVQLFVLQVARCDAAVIWEYNLKNLGPSGPLGNSYSIVKTGLIDGGVSFTATLTVTANAISGDSIIGYQEAGGLGVVGTLPGGNTLDGPNGAESLRFVMQLSNFVGGSAVFNGFTTVGFSAFSGTDRAFLSKDNDLSSIADNEGIGSGTALTAFDPTGSPTAFTIFSHLGQFQIASVEGTFTGTAAAVPEPSAFVVMAIASSTLPLVRRFRRRPNSIDSQSLVA